VIGLQGRCWFFLKRISIYIVKLIYELGISSKETSYEFSLVFIQYSAALVT